MVEIKKTRMTCFKSDGISVRICEGDEKAVTVMRSSDSSITFPDKARFRQFLQDCLKVLDKSDE